MNTNTNMNTKKNEISCYNGSNNIYTDFPALMSSGNFPKSNTACRSNNELKKNNGIEDNSDYRQFLIQNADNLILYNQEKACDNCSGCLATFKPRPTAQKFLFASCGDSSKPFGYETSDLKNMYLSKKALQSRISAPIMTQSEMLQFPRHN